MKKLTIVLLAALVLSAAIYFIFFHGAPKPAGALPELMALAPSESEWVVFVDLASWRSSSVPQQLAKLLPNVAEGADYRAFVNATGFDYSRDLDRAVLALLPAADSAVRRESPYQTIVFAEGRFDRNKITQHALNNGTKETHDGTELFLVAGARAPTRQHRDDATLFTFLSDRRVAIADVPGGHADSLNRGRELILSAARGEAPSSPSAAFTERAGRIAGAPFFAVGRTDALEQAKNSLGPASPIATQVAGLVADIRWLTIAARPEQDQIRLSVLGECESMLKATQLGLLLDGLLLFSRSALDDPKSQKGMTREQVELLQRMLGTAKIVREKNVVEIRLQVPIRLLAATSENTR